jgi:hypothetical protein
MKVHGVVDQIAEHGEQAEACRCPKCDSVASEIAGDEFFGVEAEESSDTADGESDAEGKRHLFTLEPAADDRALHHDQRFRSAAED